MLRFCWQQPLAFFTGCSSRPQGALCCVCVVEADAAAACGSRCTHGTHLRRVLTRTVNRLTKFFVVVAGLHRKVGHPCCRTALPAAGGVFTCDTELYRPLDVPVALKVEAARSSQTLGYAEQSTRRVPIGWCSFRSPVAQTPSVCRVPVVRTVNFGIPSNEVLIV
jgi:hypothetical protein